ncbi:MAG: hypothetical protein ACKOPT_05245 [Cyanobium sp.]
MTAQRPARSTAMRLMMAVCLPASIAGKGLALAAGSAAARSVVAGWRRRVARLQAPAGPRPAAATAPAQAEQGGGGARSSGQGLLQG